MTPEPRQLPIAALELDLIGIYVTPDGWAVNSYSEPIEAYFPLEFTEIFLIQQTAR